MALDAKTRALQRKLIGSGLTPRGVRSIETKIRSVVDHFAETLYGRTGVVEIMKEFTTPIPIVVIGTITGVTAPGVDDATFSELAQETIRGFFGFVSEEVQERSERNDLQLSNWVRETIRMRKAKPENLLTFGLGPHSCLGANLAKAELTNIIDAALDFLPAGATVLEDQIETESPGLFDRNKTCPVDFGSGR